MFSPSVNPLVCTSETTQGFTADERREYEAYLDSRESEEYDDHDYDDGQYEDYDDSDYDDYDYGYDDDGRYDDDPSPYDGNYSEE